MNRTTRRFAAGLAVATAAGGAGVYVSIPTPEADAVTYSTGWQDAYDYMRHRCDTGFFDTTTCLVVQVTSMASVGWSSPAPGALPPLGWNGAWTWRGRTVEADSGICRIRKFYAGAITKPGAVVRVTVSRRRTCS